MRDRLKILTFYLIRYKWKYLIGLFALIGTDIFMLLRPKVVGHIIDSLKDQSRVALLGWMVGLFLVFVLSENFFRMVWRYLLIGASRRIERDFMNDFFAHLLKIDPRFFDRTPTGDLMARATNDVASLRMLMGPGIMAMCDAVIVFGMTLFFMIKISLILTVYSLAPIPILALLIGYLLRHIHILYDTVQAQFSTISARAQENLSGIRVIKAHNREEHEIEEFRGVTSSYVDKFLKLTKYEAALEPVIRLVAGLGMVITLFIGGQYVIEGRISIGQLVEFFLYFWIITWPVIAVGWSANLFERGMASLKRLQNILDEKPTILNVDYDLHAEIKSNVDEEGKDSDTFKPGDIKFTNVYYRYLPEGPDAIKGIDLSIPAGSTLGIVGPTGSGKTTLLNLIARLYDPTQGTIEISGRDIKTFPVEELRGQIGFVPQEPFLFSLNIRENLNLGQRHNPLEDEHILTALDLADILKDVEEFPKQFDTVLGERGVRLSGGQKQRMTIARAMARRNSIILLDDTLSSVDAQTEERIIQNLNSFGEGRTNVIVSHRISSVKGADLIIVLSEDGEISERGTHRELITLGGFYARLFEQQTLMDEIERM